MNKEKMDAYRLNTAAMLYRNIFASQEPYEKVSLVLNLLESLTCAGIIISPSMSFKLDKDSEKYERFDKKLIERAREKKEIYVDYSGITIPLIILAPIAEKETFDSHIEAIVDGCNEIITCVLKTVFDKDLDSDISIYVRPKMVDYISAVDYDWTGDDFTKTLNSISDMIDVFIKRFKFHKEL